MSNGIRTPDLDTSPLIDDLIGNRTEAGVPSTRRIPVDDLAMQMAGSGPLADAIAGRVAAAAATFSVRNGPQGRVSLASTQPVSETDVANGGAVYYLPSTGPLVPIFNGGGFDWRNIPAGMSLPLTPTSTFPGWHAANFNYDLFAVLIGDAVRLGTGPNWGAGAVAPGDLTKDRGTGVGSTELTTLQGILVNKNPIQIRLGSAQTDYQVVSANQATYLGSIKCAANGIARDTRQSRLVYNAYNQALRPLSRLETAASWDYTVAGWRQSKGNPLNQVDVLFGLSGALVDLTMGAIASNSTLTVRSAMVGIGVDSLVTPNVFKPFLIGFAQSSGQVRYVNSPGRGYHFFPMLEYGSGEGAETVKWFTGTEIIGQVLI